MKIDLVIEIFDTVQVADDKWRDATRLELLEVDVPDKIVVKIKDRKLRVIGAAIRAAGPEEK
jgi:carbamoylphosphate synthase large subunit